MNSTRPARRTNTPSPLDNIVLTHHNSMTAPQMSDKFGYHVSSFHYAAKRVGVKLIDSRGRSREQATLTQLNATEVVQQFHQTMTIYEMMEKFGFTMSHLRNTAKKLQVKIKPKKAAHARSAKSLEREAKRVNNPSRAPRVKAKPVPPVMKNRAKPEVKPRKESNSRNPERFAVRKVDYSAMRMLPVGIDNQFFYMAQDATDQEIAAERERRVRRIEDKKKREKLTGLK